MEDHHHPHHHHDHDQVQKELQLLPAPHNITTTSSSDQYSLLKLRSTTITTDDGPPCLDLQLSTNLIPIITHHQEKVVVEGSTNSSGTSIETLKWQAAEQIWLAAIEKAYAERMRELSRREMELAQNEFSHATILREKAKEELDQAQKLKERSTSTTTTMEITCHSCSQKFRP